MIALTVLNLAARMIDAAARANDPDLRYENETDAVLFGKLTELETIAESVWSGELTLTAQEERAMRTAQAAMDQAWNRLADIVFPFPATATALNRLLLCRVLLGDCVAELGLHPQLLQAGEAVSLLLAELPTSPAASPPSGTTCQKSSGPFGQSDLERIGSDLPALLSALQARLPVPSAAGSPPSFSSRPA